MKIKSEIIFETKNIDVKKQRIEKNFKYKCQKKNAKKLVSIIFVDVFQIKLMKKFCYLSSATELTINTF